ncbi:MAG: hypothetical protein OQK09_05455 [Colwellia sp.]|nr:hypothetical protein [Colwellia sp.]MCW9080939.1 hypothetical protein [Colwellia sp.]
MFYRSAFKWLFITVIVLVGFLVVLLFLGYLLKENEVITTKLKTKLDHEARQQQAKEARKSEPFYNIKVPLTATEKSQQKIIADNQSCQMDNQCFLVHTDSQALGCIVSVNTKGAAILIRVGAQNKPLNTRNEYSAQAQCQLEYSKQGELLAQCVQNRCTF